MNGRLDWTQLFFTSTGRLSRTPFVISGAILLMTAWLYEAVSSPAMWILGWVVYPFLLWCGVSIAAKRWHDRGRSGWWATPVVLALLAVWNPAAPGFLKALFYFLLIWAAVELAVMPGEQGANRFGPNPLQLSHA